MNNETGIFYHHFPKSIFLKCTKIKTSPFDPSLKSWKNPAERWIKRKLKVWALLSHFGTALGFLMYFKNDCEDHQPKV